MLFIIGTIIIIFKFDAIIVSTITDITIMISMIMIMIIIAITVTELHTVQCN